MITRHNSARSRSRRQAQLNVRFRLRRIAISFSPRWLPVLVLMKRRDVVARADFERIQSRVISEVRLLLRQNHADFEQPLAEQTGGWSCLRARMSKQPINQIFAAESAKRG